MSRILVVAAHPDDEILGCGATVAKLSSEGHSVHSLILGEGIAARFKSRSDASEKAFTALEKSANRAARALGVKKVTLTSFPDNRFDSVALLDIVKTVEYHVQQFKPSVVYTHHASDLNVDHRITHQAVVTATRPLEGQSVKALYAFETASATEWSFRRDGLVFRPNVFVDVSKSFSKKIKALNAYRSEMRPFPHPRSAKALEAAARKWGSVSHVPLAEAFELIRSIP